MNGIDRDDADRAGGTVTPSNSMSSTISRTMIGAVGNNRNDRSRPADDRELLDMRGRDRSLPGHRSISSSMRASHSGLCEIK
jgi:hypothetical protein